MVTAARRYLTQTENKCTKKTLRSSTKCRIRLSQPFQRPDRYCERVSADFARVLEHRNFNAHQHGLCDRALSTYRGNFDAAAVVQVHRRGKHGVDGKERELQTLSRRLYDEGCLEIYRARIREILDVSRGSAPISALRAKSIEVGPARPASA